MHLIGMKEEMKGEHPQKASINPDSNQLGKFKALRLVKICQHARSFVIVTQKYISSTPVVIIQMLEEAIRSPKHVIIQKRKTTQS